MSDARLVGSTTRFGHTLKSWEMDVPWDHNNPNTNDTLTIFAREIVPPKGEELPLLVYLQGGPGFPSPRPTSASGWLGEFLKHYRVLLLDQRGTGRSGRVDKVNVLPTERYPLLRADSIVADCEAFRCAFGVDTWSLFGQSFGGFCITTYASMFPESLERVFLTGGLPAIDCHADDIYRATFDKLQFRHDQFYRHFPWIEARIREVCAHLDHSDELLPTGERLTDHRFQMAGHYLGGRWRERGLHYFLETAFAEGDDHLSDQFLSSMSGEVSFLANPLYALMHETIYADGPADGNLPGIPGFTVSPSPAPTNWAAARVAAKRPEFAPDAETLFFTGEHIFPWYYEEDPALRPLAEVAQLLAEKKDWGRLYDHEQLHRNEVPVVAAAYTPDIYVDYENSMETARWVGNTHVWTSKTHHHDGFGSDPLTILGHLKNMLAEVHNQ